MQPGPSGISMGTLWTPVHSEPFLLAEELNLPYPQSQLLSGSLTDDISTPEDEPLLLLPEKPVALRHCNPPVPTIPSLPEQLSESEEFSEMEPLFSLM